MIWKLRKKFIIIATLAFICVFLILLAFIYGFSVVHTNNQLDELADIISANDGAFPDFFPEKDMPTERPDINQGGMPNDPPSIKPPSGIDEESKFTTRFFTVRLDQNNKIIGTDLNSIASISKLDAETYTSQALNSGKVRGWIEDFRYKIYDTSFGQSIVFVHGSMQKDSFENFLYIALTVFVAGSVLSLFIIILVSKHAVRPVAESYEKQKQFVTDASHELKTPLTLILANLDIAESELGKNEWLDDIRNSGIQMTELVKQLIMLSKMDEDRTVLECEDFSLSDTVTECVGFFGGLSNQKGIRITDDIEADITYHGNETALRQVISILIDNAVKYCDHGGQIHISIKGKRHPVITVENTYANVGSIELERLFDRFYRADKARTTGDGFGVGLSVAKAMVEKHNGEISVQNINNNAIRFTVKL